MANFTLQGTVQDSTGNVTTTAVTITVTSGGPSVALTPTTLVFGNQSVGTTSTILSAILTNVSAARILFPGGSSMTGSPDFHYITDSCAGGGLNAGASCTLQYTFAPTSAGAKTGANLIQYNDGTAQTISLSFTGTGIAVTPPPTGSIVDPTLLPVANKQVPNNTAYTALNVSNQSAGFVYVDPVTGVRIWKATSPVIPTANTGAGHDYGDSGNEVSRGWGSGNNTHTILIRGDGMAYHLVDFTRNVGFSNYRLLTVQPARDLCASFSNVVGSERILYIHTGSQLVRYNTATMAVANIGFFPLAQTIYSWLHQDMNDIWFTGLLADNQTVWVWNSQTNQFLTRNETWTNEPRLERNGRYVLLSASAENGNVMVWDLLNNTFGPLQQAPALGHCASLRGRWVATNTVASAPPPLDRYQIVGGSVTRTAAINTNGAGYSTNNSGNWVQADDDAQWAYVTGTDQGAAWQSLILVNRGIGLFRANGADARLLCHHYGSHTPYFATVWGKPSPDGKVVIFNSNMGGSARYDLFVAEVPLR